ncbi:MAG: D-alanyl-D-alanine carboxypeptidase/D-alanyl-D-alanine-endopeptidase [Gemmatimonadota bacterium]
MQHFIKVVAMRAVRLAFFLLAVQTPLTAQQDSVLAAPTGGSLQARAAQIVDGVSGDWSVFAWSIDGESTLISINATEPLVPASNNKIFTGIWALDELGPEHRFHTDLLVAGPVESGVLRGDVVLRGSGDPAFGYPRRLGHPEFVEEPLTPLRTMAQQLVREGVRVVEGDIVGDPAVFDTVLVGPDWPADTGAGAAQYAPRVSGLAFQRNMLWLVAIPRSGGPAEIRLDPPVDVIPVVATVRTGAGRALAVRRPDEDTIRISGAVAGAGTHRYGVGVADPALLAAGALTHALREAGIEVRGAARVGATPEDAILVHRHVSMPVGLMIPFLNQDSDNFFAEHLWKASAAAATGIGSYHRGGPASALHFIQNAGVPPGEIYQFDGSGLSGLSRTSAHALVRALIYANRKPYADLWHASMAVAADPEGTLNRLFRGTPAAGNLHAKTGFIRGARTLSGYVRSRSGELIAFSFLYNGGNTNGARAAQEDLGVLLSEHGGN